MVMMADRRSLDCEFKSHKSLFHLIFLSSNHLIMIFLVQNKKNSITPPVDFEEH